MGKIDEWYNEADEEYPPQIGYCDMGDIDYNCGYREAFVKGLERGERTMIERACEWLALNAELYGGFNHGKLEEMIKKFKKAMEE